MDSWHLKPRCSVRIDAKPVLRIICVDFLSIATVKITLIKRELEDISGYPECSITFNGQLRNAIHSLYTSNAIVQRQPWQSEAATRLSGGGPLGPERTATTG